MYYRYKQYISHLHDTKKYRSLPVIHKNYKKDILDFSTNDYLQLAYHPNLINAATMAGSTYGVGATGSRLLSGNNELFERLETTIAQDKHTETAMLFISGFQTNVSVLSALLDHHVLRMQPLVFFDKLNHASLYQAIFLSKAELIRYYHNNMEHLSSLLKKYKDDNRPKFIVTETLFGMDGDIAPLTDIVSLSSQYQTFLYLDEAHATGLTGIHGYGLSTTVNLSHIPHIVMGTFSKALGCSGGYIACKQLIKDYLINKATGFIYSTAGSPMVLGAAQEAWNLIRTLNNQRAHLNSLSKELRDGCSQLGFNIGTSSSHIIPLILGSEEDASHVHKKLLEHHILTSYIRPPTVPPKTSRIRIALNVGHNKADIERLLQLLSTL